MKELYVKVTEDSALQSKFSEIMRDAEKAGAEATKEKLIAFAKEAGFDVNMDEVREFFKALSEQNEGTLSDAELDAVAGGKSPHGSMVLAASVLSLMIACGLVSAANGRACGNMFN